MKKYSRVVDEKERGGKKCKKQSVRHMNTCVQWGEKEFFVMALVMGIILQLLAPRRKKIEKHIYILKKYSRVVDEEERGGKKCKKQSVRHMNTCVQRGEKEFSSWPW